MYCILGPISTQPGQPYDNPTTSYNIKVIFYLCARPSAIDDMSDSGKPESEIRM
jgi:hypothetical protein